MDAAVNALSLNIVAKPIHFPVIGAGIARRFAKTETGVARPWFGISKYAWGGETISVETLRVPHYLLNKPMILVVANAGNYRLFDSDDRFLLKGRVGQSAEKVWASGDKVRLLVSALKARPGTHFHVLRFSIGQATTRILDNFSIREKGAQTGIFQLSYSGPKRMQITKVLNEITNVYLRQNVERNLELAKKSRAFLDKQLPSLKHRVDVAEANYNDYRMRYGSIDRTQETRIVLENYVRVDAKIMSLKQQRRELRQRFKAAHPRVRALDTKIVVLDKQQGTLNKKSEKFLLGAG